jgi:probable addiction module antidote protein
MKTQPTIPIHSLSSFDPAAYLNTEEDMAAYLTVIMEDGTPQEIAKALGDIARARGMTNMAQQTGLSRESLYKSLSGGRVPSVDTLLKVIRALGLTVSFKPAVGLGVVTG